MIDFQSANSTSNSGYRPAGGVPSPNPMPAMQTAMPGTPNVGMPMNAPSHGMNPSPSPSPNPSPNPPHLNATLGVNQASPLVNSGFNARPRPKAESGNFPSPDVPDLITLIERLIDRRHDGILMGFDQEDREGSIYFRGGRVYFASLDDPHRVSDTPLNPLNCITRIGCWTQGRFKVKSSSNLPSFEGELRNEDSRSLMDQIRQSCSELQALRSQLPPSHVSLRVPIPLEPPLTHLTPDQLMIFQYCMNQYNPRLVAESHSLGEREGIQTLLYLLNHKYLEY